MSLKSTAECEAVETAFAFLLARELRSHTVQVTEHKCTYSAAPAYYILPVLHTYTALSLSDSHCQVCSCSPRRRPPFIIPSMRLKSRPTRPARGPPKRRRSDPIDNWRTTATAAWSHYEWFVSLIDAPFFNFSEFHYLLTNVLNLGSLRHSATRIQLARVRAAMCNAIPGRFAQPRRLSSSFLAAEVQELAMYRTDARRVLRGLRLLSANDPTTLEPLPRHWWSRYRCPPPDIPQPSAALLVREPHIGSLPRLRPAEFVAFEAESEIRVRFVDDGSECAVNDLDVMLCSPTSSSSFNPPVLATTAPADAVSPASSGLQFSPGSLFDPLSFEPARTDGPLPVVAPSPRRLVLSPHRLSTPGRSQMTPRRSRLPHTETIECDVDVRQVAESMRLLDRKTELLNLLRDLSNEVEVSGATTPTLAQQARFSQISSELASLRHELLLVSGGDLVTPVEMADPELETPPPRTPDAKLQLPTDLRPGAPASPTSERVHRPINFHSTTGAVTLAKAITRMAAANLEDSALQNLPDDTRADVMNCVSGCVAVMVCARATGDRQAVQELIDSIPLRSQDSERAIDALVAASRLDSGSSDSP